jgi:autotransporter-associated beta strand protein
LDVLVGGGSGDGSPVVDVFGSNGFTPSVSWELETVTFTEQSGSHQFAIEGLNQAGDETAYVTDVNLTAPYAGGSVTNSIPAGSAVILSAGTTLDVNSSIQTIGSLNGPSGSTVTLGSGTLSVGGDNTSVTFAGSIIDGANGAGGSLTKIGSGVQTLTGSNSYTGSTNVSGGTLVIANHGALPASTPVAVGRSATLVLDSQATESGITSFNLNGNLIVHGGSLSTINADVAAGYNSGNWNGSGTGAISSTSAASDSTHLTALGVIQNSVNGSPAGSVLYSSFEGQTGLVSSDVLVKYTYYGDTNLDGKVDGSDYSRIDNGSLNQLTGWYNGDFNYDGVINGSDYTLIDNSYNTQGAEISAEIGGPSASVTAEIAGSGSSSAVPEPTALGLLCVGSVGLLRRRRVPR